MKRPENCKVTILVEAQSARLGTVSDAKLARELKVSVAMVYKARRDKGIPAFVAEGSVKRINKERELLLGTMSDKRLAELWGMKPSAVTKRRVELGIPRSWSKLGRFNQLTADQFQRLGTAPDAELAKEFGLPTSTLHYIRTQNGIEAFREKKLHTSATLRAYRKAYSKAWYDRNHKEVCSAQRRRWLDISNARFEEGVAHLSNIKIKS